MLLSWKIKSTRNDDDFALDSPAIAFSFPSTQDERGSCSRASGIWRYPPDSRDILKGAGVGGWDRELLAELLQSLFGNRGHCEYGLGLAGTFQALDFDPQPA